MCRVSPSKDSKSSTAPITVTISAETVKQALASTSGGGASASTAFPFPSPKKSPAGKGASSLAVPASPQPLASPSHGPSFDTPVDLTFSYSQRSPYSYAASNPTTRISLASQGQATYASFSRSALLCPALPCSLLCCEVEDVRDR
jgi:hypothetical protein